MLEQTPFGRRQAPLAPAPARTARVAPPGTASPHGLSAEAEAFRAELAASRPGRSSGLDQWRRSRRGRRILFWVVSLGVMSPGVICFVFQTPLSLSIGLEVAGLVVNGWLRRERKRQLSEIVAWEDPATDD